MTFDQGCNHDRAADNACLCPGYNFGYKNPIQRFTDIMSYDCPDCHCQYNCGTDWCPTAARISNTNFLYNGHPIGDKKNNCARTINEIKSIIASYFDSSTGGCDTCWEGYKFTTRADLISAVGGYPSNLGTYGAMKCWDVSSINDMSYLFK